MEEVQNSQYPLCLYFLLSDEWLLNELESVLFPMNSSVPRDAGTVVGQGKEANRNEKGTNYRRRAKRAENLRDFKAKILWDIFVAIPWLLSVPINNC